MQRHFDTLPCAWHLPDKRHVVLLDDISGTR